MALAHTCTHTLQWRLEQGAQGRAAHSRNSLIVGPYLYRPIGDLLGYRIGFSIMISRQWNTPINSPIGRAHQRCVSWRRLLLLYMLGDRQSAQGRAAHSSHQRLPAFVSRRRPLLRVLLIPCSRGYHAAATTAAAFDGLPTQARAEEGQVAKPRVVLLVLAAAQERQGLVGRLLVLVLLLLLLRRAYWGDGG